MATTNEEERDLETQLELQLQDQKDSLAALNEALDSDPSNSELISVSEELVLAIKGAEEGLFHLKRARLLREIDSKLVDSSHGVDKDANAGESLDPEPLEEHLGYSVGSKCRFRYSDGRWYNGQIVALDGSISAKISFLTPTSTNMLMCKFFRQQRCRFGSNCRLSHGIDVPFSSLKKYIPTVWEKSLVGSSILATSDGNGGLWRGAELDSWDDELGVAKVVFGDNRSSANLGNEAITLSEYAEVTDEEESGSGLDVSCSSDDDDDNDDENSRGLGFLDTSALQRGIQKETTIFAKWENHTRGIASKMMANMGYREGMGLGASGQGMVDPIPVRVLPAKQSLDLAVESREGEKVGSGKKRSRGGKRKREKKFAALARAAKSEAETAPDVFAIINTRLARQGEAQNGDSGRKHKVDGDSSGGRKVDRRSLVAYDHEVKGLRTKVQRLEEMVNRNRGDKIVYEAAMRKLAEMRKALADAEAARDSASNEVLSREKEKRWLKF